MGIVISKEALIGFLCIIILRGTIKKRKEIIMGGKQVIYNGQELTLTRYFGGPCLFINNPSQKSMPKMEFVGGYPNEYCIYLKDLTEEEKSLITDLDGNEIDIEEELSKIS